MSQTQEVAILDRPRRDVAAVQDPIPLFDAAKFEMMQRVATAMARGSLVPETLTHIKPKGAQDPVPLPYETVLANCFLVVNQAMRWGLDPFAVAQCVSVVHGKLCYEGKLVAAVLDAKIGVRLRYEWNDKTGDAMAIKVSGQLPDGSVESVDGTVGDWKTSGNNSPWGKASNHKKMLAYRGAREWARLHSPGVLLGVYGDDELLDLAENARARRATPVHGQSYNPLVDNETVDADTGEITNSKPAVSNGQATPGGAEQTNESQTPASTERLAAEPGREGEMPSTQSEPAVVHPPSPDVPDGGSTSSAERGADQGGSVSPQGAPVTNYAYGDYARALARASQEKSLKSFDEQFRLKASWTTEEDAKPTLRDIFVLHRKKLRGEVTPAAFMDELKKLGAAA